jgi:hypothetical protein
MAVPVIGVTSVTKVPFSVYKHDGGNMTSSATYVDVTDLTIPAVVDGDKVFLNWMGHHSSNNNRGAVRLIGATSGTVIHEREVLVGDVHTQPLQMGIWDLTKTTGTTEDIKVQAKSNYSNFHSEGMIHTGKSTGQLQRAFVGSTDSEIKSTMQIDEIDFCTIGYCSTHNGAGCSTIGYCNTSRDTTIQTFTPNIMVNSLNFANTETTTSPYRFTYVLYTFTGKKLVMS